MVGPSVSSSVDMSMIPSAVVERVEILKDGASAIYGADAVGGVINIITKEDFVGAEITAYTGMSQRGDGMNVSVNGVVGADVGDGNVWVALDYTSRALLWQATASSQVRQRVPLWCGR